MNIALIPEPAPIAHPEQRREWIIARVAASAPFVYGIDVQVRSREFGEGNDMHRADAAEQCWCSAIRLETRQAGCPPP